MDIKIASRCFIKQSSDIIDSAGNSIPSKSVIFCKKRAFIFTENGDINKFSGGEKDVIY